MTQAATSGTKMAALENETQRAISELQKRQNVTMNFLAKVEDTERKLAQVTTSPQASTNVDESQAQIERIINSDLASLRSDFAVEEKDLSQAVLGLHTLLEGFGEQYATLEAPTAEETAIIARAKAKIEEAKAGLDDAKVSFNILGSRARKVAAAETALAMAETAFQEAETQVKSLSRNRLMSADMDTALQTFQLKVRGTIRIMTERRKVLDEQYHIVSAQKLRALGVKQEAAKALEQLNIELTKLEEEYRAATEEHSLLEKGSVEEVQKETLVTGLKNAVEQTRGRRNVALVVYQSKERFATELEIHEGAQLKLRDNQDTWINLLESDTNERVITFKSRLEAMKGMADQDVASRLNTMGQTVDQNNAAALAAIGAASDRKTMEMFEGQPGAVRNMAAIMAKAARAEADVRKRMGGALEEFRKSYGVDPLASSFLSYEEAPPSA